MPVAKTGLYEKQKGWALARPERPEGCLQIGPEERAVLSTMCRFPTGATDRELRQSMQRILSPRELRASQVRLSRSALIYFEISTGSWRVSEAGGRLACSLPPQFPDATQGEGKP